MMSQTFSEGKGVETLTKGHRLYGRLPRRRPSQKVKVLKPSKLDQGPVLDGCRRPSQKVKVLKRGFEDMHPDSVIGRRPSQKVKVLKLQRHHFLSGGGTHVADLLRR